MEFSPTELKDIIAAPHTAVLVVDMQNAFCDEKGALAKRGQDITAARALIPRLQSFLEKAKEKGVTTIFIQHVKTDQEDSGPDKELWKRHGGELDRSMFTPGNWGADIVPELKPAENDIIIQKTRYSAFIKTGLEELLQKLGIASLIVTGVSTNVCVESTCRDGFMLDYYIIVPEDLVANTEYEYHKGSLHNLDRYFANVIATDQILKNWD